ncbi:MAG: recombinase family protein [Cyanobacteriota bacterium]|nr:recombinase family protein [Cyanobacteriota bacterium]
MRDRADGSFVLGVFSVPFESVWITGATRSGKTTRLVELLEQWVENTIAPPKNHRSSVPKPLQTQQSSPAILVLAANGDNRIALRDRIDTTLQGKAPVHSTTPLGFFLDETILFWPLLVEKLNLRAKFPMRLRPETEQELATQLWQPQLDRGVLRQEGLNEYRSVRRTLDLLQLAAASGTPVEEIPNVLEAGMEEGSPELWQAMGDALLAWRDWCWERGFLTYGIAFELYWRHLLPHPTYDRYLQTHYGGVLADDVDEYPGIARHLFEVFLDADKPCAFTYNPDGAVRLGLNANPEALATLARRCRVEVLNQQQGLAENLGESMVCLTLDPAFFTQLPSQISSIQTGSRSQLLRQTAEAVADAVRSGIAPQDIAIIAPGMDAIARYTLSEILDGSGIATQSLNLQRPLIASPDVRALLTLLALVYPGLGRLVDRDAISEMLVMLSSGDRPIAQRDTLTFHAIDPVRAGLIADYCYEPDPDRPKLLPVTEFPRWDRLGYRATEAYNSLLAWLVQIQEQIEQRLIPGPVFVLDRAVAQFLWDKNRLPYDRLAILRELLETAQHYWDVASRLEGKEPHSATCERFVQLLRRGTVAANPYPVRPASSRAAVTLANIFQYRASRASHPWHFWLDISSPLWASGGSAVLFGAPLFLENRSGRPWTADDIEEADRDRIRRILLDLLGRADDRVILGHSDLAANGQEQLGLLLSLVNASVPLEGVLR